jgi:hypothetical protein
LLREDRGMAQSSLCSNGNQLVVGNAAPEEEREARRQLEIRDPVRSAGLQGPAPSRLERFTLGATRN